MNSTNTDQFVKLVLGLCIIIHFAVFILAFTSKRFLQFVSLLNGTVAFSLLFYWIRKQAIINQHFFDIKEITVVLAELTLLVVSIFSIFKHTDQQWVKVIQYVFFGLHIVALILFTCFMLFFKMNKLF